MTRFKVTYAEQACLVCRGLDCVTTGINVRFLKALPVEKEVKVIRKD